MNISFELASSMSPKNFGPKKHYKHAPSVLALRKPFRRSLTLDRKKPTVPNDSIVIIENLTDTESSATGSGIIPTTTRLDVIVIDDTLDRVEGAAALQNDLLTRDKRSNIEEWLEKVHSETEQNSASNSTNVFTDLSRICNSDDSTFSLDHTAQAVNSTFAPNHEKCFQDLFEKKKVDVESSTDVDVGSGVKKTSQSFAKLFIEDSFELGLDESLTTRLKKSENKSKESSYKSCKSELSLEKKVEDDYKENVAANANEDDEAAQKLLDELYGKQWRAKQDEILPKSDQRPKKPIKPTTNTDIKPRRNPFKLPNPYLDSERKKSNNLLKNLQKERIKVKESKSPWLQRINALCDTDASDDDPQKPIQRAKLNFDSDEEIATKSKYFTPRKLPARIASSSSSSSSLKQLYSDSSSSKAKSDENSSHKKSIKKKGSTRKKWESESSSSDEEEVIKSTKIVTKPSSDQCYSFLTSLSGFVPLSKIDYSAKIYRDNFKLYKVQLAEKLFKLYNEKVFDNAIPTTTQLIWSNDLRKTAGNCSCKKISYRSGEVARTVTINLASKVLTSAERLRDTLIHEMCHAATWIVNELSDGHGAYWKSWTYKAMKVFPELPPINRCHSYAIETKYTYKCAQCGYSIGRHTKSLDTDRKRCGFCMGTFEVFINKTTKTGEIKSVPSTPRGKGKPTQFALFVKDNYKTYKTPDRNHKIVMQMLGQKFSEVKLQADLV